MIRPPTYTPPGPRLTYVSVSDLRQRQSGCCWPVTDRCFNKGQSRRAGTILVRDAWSRSYQVTPSGGSAPNRCSRRIWKLRAHLIHVAGKEMSQTAPVRTRTLPTHLQSKTAETPVSL